MLWSGQLSFESNRFDMNYRKCTRFVLDWNKKKRINEEGKIIMRYVKGNRSIMNKEAWGLLRLADPTIKRILKDIIN